MALAPDDLFAALAALGIETATVDHAPVFTVEESRRLRGSIAGAHTKNLFLRDNKKAFFLVCLDEEHATDLKALRPLIGARGGLSFASAEALFEHLGVCPGSVSPFALINDTAGTVTFAIDAELMRSTVINIHPLINEKTTAIAPADLLAFLRSTRHEAKVIDFESAPIGEPG